MLETSLKKRFILFAVALSLLVTFNSFAQNSTKVAEAYVKEGDQYYEKKDYNGALERYLKALKSDKEYPDAYSAIARTLAQMHEHKTSAEYYIAFLLKTKDNPNIYRLRVVYWIGNQYRLAKEFELSNKFFDLALQSTPKYAADYEAVASIYSYRGNLSSAVENEIRAINFENDDTDEDVGRYISLSWNYSFLQQHQKAVDMATKAIQLNSSEAMAYTNRCRAYNDLKLFDNAITDCRKALSLRPDHGETQYYMANSYRGKGNLKEATRLNKLSIPNLFNELKEAVDTEAISLHDYCYLLGNALFEDKQYSVAVTAYEKGLEFRANFPLLRFNLGVAQLKTGNKRGALEQYKELLSIDTTKAAALKRRIDLAK